ncbi:hypothetical protein MKZ15_21105 [Paenibacillus sp. FSL R7-0216]|uniref:hypothetical protein n=1 Tax=Paenibacillus sp. FSL R7-0216 TaxID=2921677 RepID=UPI0030D90A30
MNINEELQQLLALMEEIFTAIQGNGQFIENRINSFIDGFLFTKKNISQRNINENVEMVFSNLENVLFLIVTSYNSNNIEQAKKYIGEEFYEVFPLWLETVKQELRHNIVILGVNYRSKLITSLFEETLYNVVGYCSYSKVSLSDTHLANLPIFECSSVNPTLFDYLVIADDITEQEEKLLIEQFGESKIVNLYRIASEYAQTYRTIFEKYYYYSLLYTNLKTAKTEKNVEIITTGTSHAVHGLDTELMWKKTIKLCGISQDLYYDYLLAKEAIRSNQNIKYCLIGLSQFSMGYDLSLSKNQVSLIDEIYYPLLQDSHHYSLSRKNDKTIRIDTIEKYFNIPSPFNQKIIDSFLESLNFIDPSPQIKQSYWDNPCENFPIEWLGKERALRHNKQIHSKTINENRQILRDYLSFLERNKVKPIVIIYPTTLYYNNFIDSSLKDTIYQVLEELQKDFDITFLDLSTSSLFNLNDFADSDHLNKKGATKMSLLLNKLLIDTKLEIE